MKGLGFRVEGLEFRGPKLNLTHSSADQAFDFQQEAAALMQESKASGSPPPGAALSIPAHPNAIDRNILRVHTPQA